LADGSVGRFAAQSLSAATVAAYRSDWGRFVRWCESSGRCPLPATPGTVAAYLADAASVPAGTGRGWRYSPATLGRWTAGIGKAHVLAGTVSPVGAAEVRATLAGIRRARMSPPLRRLPLLLDDLERVVGRIDVRAWPVGVGGWRDRALLTVGWAGAFRRSELAGLQVGDIVCHAEDGLHVRLRHSKTDQTGQGAVRAIPFARRRPVLCAPCAWAGWLQVMGAAADGRAETLRVLRRLAADAGGHVCGRPVPAGCDPDVPAFVAVRSNGTLGGQLTGHAVNSMIKRRVGAAGLHPDRFGGHSLRAGFVTQAFRSGADAHSIMRQTGHRSPAMLEVYAREGAPLAGNAVTRVGL